jgi:hypothetical protein
MLTKELQENAEIKDPPSQGFIGEKGSASRLYVFLRIFLEFLFAN